MSFEYDWRKNASNKRKHGIDFVEAQELWKDPALLQVPASTVDDEKRFMIISRIGEAYWSAIWTPRGDNIRLISVRRATDKEIQRYEGN